MKNKETDHMPNQKWHKYISFIKSGIRLVACVLGFNGEIALAFQYLFLAEIIGIIEETV
jgi:hypothetical protein